MYDNRLGGKEVYLQIPLIPLGRPDSFLCLMYLFLKGGVIFFTTRWNSERVKPVTPLNVLGLLLSLVYKSIVAFGWQFMLKTPKVTNFGPFLFFLTLLQ